MAGASSVNASSRYAGAGQVDIEATLSAAKNFVSGPGLLGSILNTLTGKSAPNYTQTFPVSTGQGSLQAARGSERTGRRGRQSVRRRDRHPGQPVGPGRMVGRCIGRYVMVRRQLDGRPVDRSRLGHLRRWHAVGALVVGALVVGALERRQLGFRTLVVGPLVIGTLVVGAVVVGSMVRRSLAVTMRSRLTPAVWTLLLSAALAALAVLLTVATPNRPLLIEHLPVPVLAAGIAATFLCAEQFLMNIEFRRQAHSLTLAGVPLATRRAGAVTSDLRAGSPRRIAARVRRAAHRLAEDDLQHCGVRLRSRVGRGVAASAAPDLVRPRRMVRCRSRSSCWRWSTS